MPDYTPLLKDLDISLDKFDPNEPVAFSGTPEISPEIIEGIRTGNHDAYDVVFNAYHAPIKSFLTVMLRSEDEAQEMTQEVFIRLWESRENLDPGRNILNFLYQTSRFFMLDYFKHKKVILRYEQYAVHSADFEISPDDRYIAKELGILIEIAIANMPPQQQRVMKMQYHQNKSAAEIAAELNISQSTVHTHIQRGKSEIRQLIMVVLALLMMH